MGTLKISALNVFGLLMLGWIADTIALRDVQLIAPSAVKLGDTVLLGCKWTLEGNETLYSVKWYRGRQEFFSYLPKEFPFTRIFAQPGIDVDVSRSTSQQVVLREASRALAGRYRCEVSADAPSFHTQVRSAYIHVVDLHYENMINRQKHLLWTKSFWISYKMLKETHFSSEKMLQIKLKHPNQLRDQASSIKNLVRQRRHHHTSIQTEQRSVRNHKHRPDLIRELPPEKPTIKAEKGWYASGDSLRAQCSSPPADPPANLTWLLNGRDKVSWYCHWNKIAPVGKRSDGWENASQARKGVSELEYVRHNIQGKPVIQQRILPSPVVSIEVPHGPPGRSTAFPGDENSNIIFSPWKAFGPFVDTIQEGELLPSQDTVVLPTPRPHDSIDEDATDPMPTAETSKKVASISQLSFMVRPDSFERGQLRLTCISSVHAVYSEQAELVINEERPQIASVLGTRDRAGAVKASVLVTLLCLFSTFTVHLILRQIVR